MEKFNTLWCIRPPIAHGNILSFDLQSRYLCELDAVRRYVCATLAEVQCLISPLKKVEVGSSYLLK